MFLAKDVAEVINVNNHRDLLTRIDDDEKVVGLTDTLGGSQQTTFLTEDGLYEVLMQSRKPIAKEFKKGVKTILKEIRKNGGYIATSEEDDAEKVKIFCTLPSEDTNKVLSPCESVTYTGTNYYSKK